MSLGATIKRIAKFILTNVPASHVSVTVSTMSPGSILAGRRIVVTGGSRGIGFAIARACVDQGAIVAISGRSRETLEWSVTELGEAAHGIVFDVCDVDGAKPFLRKCAEELGGPIDCLVSNAGVNCYERNASAVTTEQFDLQVDTNMRGAYFLCTAFLEAKEERKEEGALLLISSEAGSMGYDIPYGMTKAAMDSFMRASARRCYKSGSGVRVNAIAPGVVYTDMTKGQISSPAGRDKAYDVAAGRLILPEEIAEVAVFLLSNASKCITGEVVHCNAGNHLKVIGDTYH